MRFAANELSWLGDHGSQKGGPRDTYPIVHIFAFRLSHPPDLALE